MKLFQLLLSTLAILCSLLVPSNAQLQISNLEKLPELEKSTTIVFMPHADTAQSVIYRKILEENWDLTELKFVTYNDYMQFKELDGYSYMLFGDDKITNSYESSSYVYFELWIWNDNVTGFLSNNKSTIARVELYPDHETTQDPSLIYDYRFDTEGHIYNWSPGMFKNYIQLINKHLKEKRERNLSELLVEEDRLKQLKQKVLYIPEYVLKLHNAMSNPMGNQSIAELMSFYNYKYKVVSTEELSNLIIKAQEPVYYLLFTRSNSNKYVSVIEGKDSEILYSRFTPLNFNLKKRDIKKLMSFIE